MENNYMSETRTLPWYQSQILQAQIVQVVTAILGLIGIAAPGDVNAAVAGVFIVIQIGAAIWASFARIRKANPPITETAVLAEEQFQAEPQR
jgi:hypothetical protein